MFKLKSLGVVAVMLLGTQLSSSSVFADTGSVTTEITPVVQSVDLGLLGLSDAVVVPVDSGRGSSAEIVIEPKDLTLEMRDGRLFASVEVALPNIDAAIDALMDTNDFRVARYFKYRHGDLVHMHAEGGSGDVINTRLALRIKNRITRDSHTHHFNVDVDLNWTSTTVHVDLDLGPKDGFPNQIEDAIQSELSKREPHFALSQELQDMGLQIESLGFKGAAETGTFAITAKLSAPVTILPSLLAGNFPTVDAIFVPIEPKVVSSAGRSYCPGGGGYVSMGEYQPCRAAP
jgi:hypothetical protein